MTMMAWSSHCERMTEEEEEEEEEEGKPRNSLKQKEIEVGLNAVTIEMYLQRCYVAVGLSTFWAPAWYQWRDPGPYWTSHCR